MTDIQKKIGSLNKQGPYAKGCMSMKSAPEEKIAVQSFVSSLPHFVKSMKKFNVSGSYTLVSSSFLFILFILFLFYLFWLFSQIFIFILNL